MTEYEAGIAFDFAELNLEIARSVYEDALKRLAEAEVVVSIIRQEVEHLAGDLNSCESDYAVCSQNLQDAQQ